MGATWLHQRPIPIININTKIDNKTAVERELNNEKLVDQYA